MKRARRQKGSLQIRKQGGKLVWAALWYDEEGHRRSKTLGAKSKLTKSQAEERLAGIVAETNAKDSDDPTVADYIAAHFLPHKRRTWKSSTRSTNEQIIQTHIVRELGHLRIRDLRREVMADHLDRKARKFSKSVVAHVRWFLNDILAFAVSDGIVQANQAAVLDIPRNTRQVSKLTATPQQAMKAVAALRLRDRLMVRLALFVGLRPGEICALQWKHIEGDRARVEQNVYRGIVQESVKNDQARTVALPPSVAIDIERWRELSFDLSPEGWVFPTDTGRAGNRDSFWRHSIHPALEPLGLGWMNFQVMRRTWATLAENAGISAKVRADQLGHGVNVDINEYTQTEFPLKMAAVVAVEGLLNSGLQTISDEVQ